MWLALQLAFTGIWNLVADYSALAIGAGVLVFASFFVDEVPILGVKIAADMRWLAAVLVACLFWGGHIEHDTNLRWEAKQATIQNAVDKAGEKAVSKPRDPSKWGTDQ